VTLITNSIESLNFPVNACIDELEQVVLIPPYEAQTLLGVNTGWHKTLVQTFTISNVFLRPVILIAILAQAFFKSLRRIFLTMST
jgi:hypothetical protein